SRAGGGRKREARDPRRAGFAELVRDIGLSRAEDRLASDRDVVRVEILGSGGATTSPRPGCACRVCVEAREKGVPYARTGPSVFVHGPNVVIDTPEEAKYQLDRAGITDIRACFYSHWHPDHTLGRRVWETRNGDFRGW